MIEMPKRSVTRFFIPLVDVMMLMFSIFLLMPVMELGSLTTADAGRMTRKEQITFINSLQKELKQQRDAKKINIGLEKELEKLRKENRKLQKYADPKIELLKLHEEVERWRRQKIDTLQKRLFIRTLEIDPENGRLIYYEPGQPPLRKVVKSVADAQDLIRADKLRPEAQNRELYYLFLFPRVDSAFPEDRQFERYKIWFKDVASGVDLSTRLATP